MELGDYLNGSHLIDYHNQALKSDDVVKLLERFGLEVIYRFDRLSEGTPDAYSVSAESEGFELRFDEHQTLETLWCYIRKRGSFSPIEPDCIGVFIPDSLAAARRHAKSGGHPSQEGGSESAKAYVRIDGPRASVHYEFDKGKLSLVTIMRPWED